MENEKEGKKEKYKKIIRIALILLVIYVFLQLSKVSVTREEVFEEEVPYTPSEGEEVQVGECYEKDFNYRYSWEGWIPEDRGYISPEMRLENLEERSGEFKVQFAFFDDTKYPFSEYQGKDYDLVKERLAWSDASMLSETVSHTLGSMDDVLITVATKKKEENGVYWVYADITPPRYVDCNYTTVYRNNTGNSVAYRTESVKKNATTKISLLEYILGKIKE
jgi:hypothetical protein